MTGSYPISRGDTTALGCRALRAGGPPATTPFGHWAWV